MTTFNLFVYGTLRSDGGAGALLDGCELLGPAEVQGTLYDIDGRFPALLRYGADTVQGELWRCPADLLLRLDRYEGVDRGLFQRVGEEAATPDGERVPCWVYAAGPALARKLSAERRIASGTWEAASSG